MRRRRHRAEPSPLSPLLRRWVRSAAGGPSPELDAIRTAWAEVAGEAVAGRTLPLRRTHAGVLTVGCADAGWAQELTARRETLLARLVRAAPDSGLTGLRFCVADHALARPAPPPAPPPAPRPPTAGEQARAEAMTAAVEDPALRVLLARAAAVSMRESA